MELITQTKTIKNLYPITLTRRLADITCGGLKLGEFGKIPQIKYPWELIELQRKIIEKNLEQKVKTLKHKNIKTLKQTNWREYQKNVYLGKKVKLADFISFDTNEGLILIDDETEIADFVKLKGPLYIGRKTQIKSFSEIGSYISIGDHCRIRGEIICSIIESHTNKGHHGFIGHSYIGSWVNLGAGTTISNLKNTYGSIKVDYQGQKIDTGRQFLGAIIGDYVKAAVNTAIYSGKIIGVGSYLYGVVSQNVPSFTQMTASGLYEVYLTSAILTQKRMFNRRGKKQTKKDINLLKRCFKLTEKDREIFGVKKERIVL